MQLHRDNTSAFNTITGYGEDYIEINHQRFSHAVYFSPEGDIYPWEVQSVKDITLQALEKAAHLEKKAPDAIDFLDDIALSYTNAPELIIIGTGKHQTFISPAIIAPLLSNRIGIEIMDSKAAARTYNILMSEGRKVAVALLIS